MFKNILATILISIFSNFFNYHLVSNDIEKIEIIKDNYYIDSIKLINYKEKVKLLKEKEAEFYIINFWASWCAPCIKEMKSLNSLQIRAPFLRVITLSQDNTISIAKEFFEKNKYDNLEKYFDYNKEILSSLPIRGLPTTFIADKNFKIFAKVEGIIEWDSDNFLDWLNNY